MLVPILLVIVPEILPIEIRSRCPEKLLYTDNLALVSEW